jgi:FMN phosphatase YigB (HAD superfamily)
VTYTLLVDLDDTLIKNDINEFLPHYLKAWGRVIAPYLDPEQFVRRLLAATKVMVANRSPDCTLQEAFDAAFFPRLGMDATQFRQLADEFYAQVYPELRLLTQPAPGAAEFIQAAQLRGYPVMVATNPLFPLTAIEQRLAWAGLPVEQVPFSLIASYETFHFAKPDPAFFAEALGLLGWPEQPAVIVGDDLTNEVAAGHQVGLPVFWIARNGAQPPAEADGPAGRGQVSDVLPWLDRLQPEALAPDYERPSALLAMLRSTPAVMDTFTRRAGPDWSVRPSPDEWSLTEILCHLRDVDAEVNLRRVQKVLDENNPFIPGEMTDPWAEQRRYDQQDCYSALQGFKGARMELVRLLESLEPQDWQRTARHAIFGPTRLIELISIQAAHDRVHVRQAAQMS